MRGDGGGWRQQREARGSAAAGVAPPRVRPCRSMARLSCQPWLVTSFWARGCVGWRGERGAAGGQRDVPHEGEGLPRVGKLVLALRHVQHARVSKVRHTALVVGASAHDHSSYGIGRIGRRVATHRTGQWVIFFADARQPCGRQRPRVSTKGSGTREERWQRCALDGTPDIGVQESAGPGGYGSPWGLVAGGCAARPNVRTRAARAGVGGDGCVCLSRAGLLGRRAPAGSPTLPRPRALEESGAAAADAVTPAAA